jgi:hypothetical protein
VNQYWLAIDKISGVEPSNAIAEARAGQILAEMLGMVCHPEYINSGTSQTVHPHPFPLSAYCVSINIRASWFTLTVSMYQSTSRTSRLPTFPPSATKTSTFSQVYLIFIYAILVDITFDTQWIEWSLFVNLSRLSDSWRRGKLR